MKRGLTFYLLAIQIFDQVLLILLYNYLFDFIFVGWRNLIYII